MRYAPRRRGGALGEGAGFTTKHTKLKEDSDFGDDRPKTASSRRKKELILPFALSPCRRGFFTHSRSAA